MRAKYISYGDRNEPREISDVLGSVIENATVDFDVRQAELVNQWHTFVEGDWLLGTPVGVREKTLLVTVPDGATASLLQYQTRPLLTAIEESYGVGLVSEIRIRVERPSSAGKSRE